MTKCLVRQGKSSVRTSAEQLWPCFTRARSVLWSGDGSNLARPSQTPKYCRRKNIFGIKQILMNITSSPPSTHYSITYDITIQYIQIPSKLVGFCYWFRNSDNNWLCLKSQSSFAWSSNSLPPSPWSWTPSRPCARPEMQNVIRFLSDSPKNSEK